MGADPGTARLWRSYERAKAAEDRLREENLRRYAAARAASAATSDRSIVTAAWQHWRALWPTYQRALALTDRLHRAYAAALAARIKTNAARPTAGEG